MVQAIENWAEIDGVVRAVRPSASGSRHLVVQVDVERVEPVEGYPNLVADAAGGLLEVTVAAPAAEEAGVQVGRRLRCRIQKTGPFVTVAHPHHVRCVDA